MTAAAVGLDLSLTSTGVAHLHDDDAERCTARIRVTATAPMGVRLRNIVSAVDEFAGLTAAEMVVIEDLPTHARAAGLTGQLHGAVKMWMADRALPPPVTVPPATLKVFATGRGNADKTAMVVAARDRLGYLGTADDEADALWLLEIGLHLLTHPARVALPATHLRALTKLAGA